MQFLFDISPWFHLVHFLVALVVFHTIVSVPTGKMVRNSEDDLVQETEWKIRSKQHLLQSVSISLAWEIALVGIMVYLLYLLLKELCVYWANLEDTDPEPQS